MNRVEGWDPSKVEFNSDSPAPIQADNSLILEQEDTTWKSSQVTVEILQDRYGPSSSVDLASTVLTDFQKREYPPLQINRQDPEPSKNTLGTQIKQGFKDLMNKLKS